MRPSAHQHDNIDNSAGPGLPVVAPPSHATTNEDGDNVKSEKPGCGEQQEVESAGSRTSLASNNAESAGLNANHRDGVSQTAVTSIKDPKDGREPVSVGPAQCITPKDLVVTISPSGAKLSNVVTTALPSPTANSNSNSNTTYISNNNDYGACHPMDRRNNNNNRKSNHADSKAGLFSTLVGNKKLLLFLLLILFVVVAAGVVLVLTLDGENSNSKDEEVHRINGTGRLTSENKGKLIPVTKGPVVVKPLTRTAPPPTIATTTKAPSAVETTPTLTTTESTTSAITIPLSYCSDDYFGCYSGEMCLGWEFVCDGFPHCVDGSDEGTDCYCSDHRFTCANGQCVAATAVCDGLKDCMDASDEVNCTACAFVCKTSGLCIRTKWSICNGIFDCDDLSDELDCAEKEGYRRCTNGVMVETAFFCDGIDNCGDNSDEDDCSACPQKSFPCSEAGGRCIPDTWKCDGHKDCSNGRDEEHCDSCSADQFVCADYSCIDASLRCDGKVNCGQHGGDEDDCLSLSPEGLLQVITATDPTTQGEKSGGLTPVPVCADGWSDTLAAQACSLLGARSLSSWKALRKDRFNTAVAAIGKPDTLAPLLSNLENVGACQDDRVVHLSCKTPECGERQVDVMESLIARGEIVPPGKWPWLVSLSYLGEPICGGVVIGHRWVLTAAHCILSAASEIFSPKFDIPSQKFTEVPFYFTVKAGTTNLFAPNSNTGNTLADTQDQLRPQIFRVLKIFLHPDMEVMRSLGVNWDIALLQLEPREISEASSAGSGAGEDGGLKFSTLVQPICLPSAREEFSSSSHCHIAGWGHISYRQYKHVQHLRDARMSVWSEARCKDSTNRWETVDTNSTLCGGFTHSLAPIACMGDSGGPLMCLDQTSGRYKLAGIISQGGANCDRSRAKNRFARVSMATDWIYQVMGNT